MESKVIMEKIKNLLESTETYDKIIDKLKSVVNLNEISGDAVIAGGSIANIIYAMIHGGNAVINDVDVYVEDAESKKGHKFRVKMTEPNDYSGLSVNVDEMEIMDDSYGRIYVSESGSIINIKSHTRKGIINEIKYHYEKPRGGRTKEIENALIDSFDLNCCNAAINLKERKIYYTKDFLKFLETKVLKVINPSSPIQTSVRLFKKIKDLNCFCDVDFEMRFLVVASKSHLNRFVTKIIGPETKAKYDRYQSLIEPYFKLRKIKKSDLMYSVFNNDESFLKISENKLWGYDAVSNITIVESFNSLVKLKKIWKLMYEEKDAIEQERINKIFYKNFFLNDFSEDTWSIQVWDPETQIVENRPFYNSYRFTFEMLLTKEGYHDCEFTVEDVDAIDKFCHKYHRTRLIFKNTQNISETVKIVRFIEDLNKKEGGWVFRFLEESTWIGNFIVNCQSGESIEDLILEVVNKEKLNNFSLTEKSFDFSGFAYRKNVTHINTAKEIRSFDANFSATELIKLSQKEYISIFKIKNENKDYLLVVNNPTKTRWTKDGDKKVIEVCQPLSFENHCFIILEDMSSQEDLVRNFIYNYRELIYKERNQNTDLSVVKKITKELVSYLNENYLPKNYKIRFKNPFNIKKFF